MSSSIGIQNIFAGIAGLLANIHNTSLNYEIKKVNQRSGANLRASFFMNKLAMFGLLYLYTRSFFIASIFVVVLFIIDLFIYDKNFNGIPDFLENTPKQENSCPHCGGKLKLETFTCSAGQCS